MALEEKDIPHQTTILHNPDGTVAHSYHVRHRAVLRDGVIIHSTPYGLEPIAPEHVSGLFPDAALPAALAKVAALESEVEGHKLRHAALEADAKNAREQARQATKRAATETHFAILSAMEPDHQRYVLQRLRDRADAPTKASAP